MNDTILITGGCGFIGTNAAVYFSNKGYKVHIVDNFSRSGSEYNKTFLETHLPANKLKVETLDITNGADGLKNLIDKENISTILHLAAQVAVTTSINDPILDFQSNALGTLNILEAARNAIHQPAVIYTSTNKVYGAMEDIATIEKKTRYSYTHLSHGVDEKVLLDFHSPYGCSKGCADQYTRDYGRIYGLNTTVFRQSCVYGGHQFGIVDQGWIAFLTALAMFEKPITIYGDGKQVRDILYVQDLVQAYEKVIEHPEKHSAQIYNIGGGLKNTLSLLEFISFLEKRFNRKIEVKFSDWRPGDQKVYISDIRHAKKSLSWTPEVSFKKGFEEMLSWIEQNKHLLEKTL